MSKKTEDKKVIKKVIEKVIVKVNRDKFNFSVNSNHSKLVILLSKKALTMKAVKEILNNTYYCCSNKYPSIFGKKKISKVFYVKNTIAATQAEKIEKIAIAAKKAADKKKADLAKKAAAAKKAKKIKIKADKEKAAKKAAIKKAAWYYWLIIKQC